VQGRAAEAGAGASCTHEVAGGAGRPPGPGDAQMEDRVAAQGVAGDAASRKRKRIRPWERVVVGGPVLGKAQGGGGVCGGDDESGHGGEGIV